MPEVATKYPQLLFQELKDAGGKCGEDITPKILKSCPKEDFCQLPTGEICIYDIKNISAMTQVTKADWHELIAGTPSMFSVANVCLLIFLFGIGFVIGAKICSRSRK